VGIIDDNCPTGAANNRIAEQKSAESVLEERMTIVLNLRQKRRSQDPIG
jgi:hypothetical protein